MSTLTDTFDRTTEEILQSHGRPALIRAIADRVETMGAYYPLFFRPDETDLFRNPHVRVALLARYWRRVWYHTDEEHREEVIAVLMGFA
jgi:hypothetical protein